MLREFFLLLCALSFVQGAAAAQPQFEIKEWPRNLRTDLKGAKIKIALPENEPDRPWNDALLAKFHDLTGIEVATIRPGNDTTVVLSSYLRDFSSGTPKADVYAIDIVLPGILSPYAEDLRSDFASLPGMVPALVENDSVHGKLVAVPYFVEISLLYYRKDLLEKYHFPAPPGTWDELEHQALVIAEGERAQDKNPFWGYLWQGAASEALTCNALEWQISEGAGFLMNPDGTISLQQAPMQRALDRARRWAGTLSPPDAATQLEDDSLRIWKQGNAAFMRNWPYAYVESMSADSLVKDRVGLTVMPAGNGPQARHADILGGFQLMISNKSESKVAARELVKFLTSPEIQRVNAATRGYAPTRPSLYDSPGLKENAFLATLKDVLLQGAVTRPSTAAGPKYDRISTAYFTAVRQAITGEKTSVAALSDLRQQLDQILSVK